MKSGNTRSGKKKGASGSSTARVQRSSRDWFKDWANDYDRTLGKMARHHALLDLVVELARPKDGERVLDVGCGTGLLGLKFLQAADCYLTAVDSSPQMLAIFQKKIAALGLKDRVDSDCRNAAALGFTRRSFDVIASTVTLHHLQNKSPAINRTYQLLRPGGRLVIGDIDLDTTGKITDQRRLERVMDYLKDEFSVALQDGGPEALSRMFDNGKKHLFNDGEYCIDFSQWSALCRQAGFERVYTRTLSVFKRFKVLVAVKSAR